MSEPPNAQINRRPAATERYRGREGWSAGAIWAAGGYYIDSVEHFSVGEHTLTLADLTNDAEEAETGRYHGEAKEHEHDRVKDCRLRIGSPNFWLLQNQSSDQV